MRDRFRRENLLHVPERSVEVQLGAVGGGDARRFLSAMLQRVEAEIRELRRLGMPENAEHAAVIVEMIVVDLDQSVHATCSLCRYSVRTVGSKSQVAIDAATRVIRAISMPNPPRGKRKNTGTAIPRFTIATKRAR